MSSDTLELMIPILAIVIGGLVVLVPIAGLTMRFALKPAMEAYRNAVAAHGGDAELRALQHRVASLEAQVQLLTRNVVEPRRVEGVSLAGSQPRADAGA